MHKIFFLPTRVSKWFPVPWERGPKLPMYRRMTPGCSGQWKNIQGVDDPKKADIFIMRDYHTADFEVDLKRTIRIGSEPRYNKAGYRPFDKSQYLGGFHHSDGDCWWNDRWWVQYTYDELMAMKPPSKTKRLSCICSKKENLAGHKKRLKFLKHYTRRYPLDLFGNISEHPSFKKHSLGSLKDKADGLARYEFSIALENGQQDNYFSEKLMDVLLMWTVPFYWGCPNIDNYFPRGSVVAINIEDKAEAASFVHSGLFAVSNRAIGEARKLVLNDYNYWELIYQMVNFGKVRI